jgi:hypothetical protein
MCFGLLCAVAAMGAVATAPDVAEKPVAVVAPALTVAAAVAVALSKDAAFDDGASVEIPLSALAIWRSPEKARGGPDFKIGGLGVNVAAFKPKLRADAFGPAGLRSDSGAMGKAMPGYPQPARIVVGFKVAF